MANGTYAKNMEIEMLKKELMKENERLDRIRRGERVSPVRLFQLKTAERFGVFQFYFSAGPDRDHPLAVIVIDAEVEVAIGVETAGIVIEVEIAARHRVIDIDHQDGIGNRVTIVPNLE